MQHKDYQLRKRGRKPLSPDQRAAQAERKRQRERDRYDKNKRKKQHEYTARTMAGGLDGDWETVLHHVDNNRDLGRVAAAVDRRGSDNTIFPDADRRAVYKRLIAIGMVEPYDYADSDGRALKLHELSPVARQAAQMVREGDMIIVGPPSQKIQLEAIKLLGQILAMKDIASMTAEMVAEKMVVAVQDASRQPGAQAVVDAETAMAAEKTSAATVMGGYEDL